MSTNKVQEVGNIISLDERRLGGNDRSPKPTPLEKPYNIESFKAHMCLVKFESSVVYASLQIMAGNGKIKKNSREYHQEYLRIHSLNMSEVDIIRTLTKVFEQKKVLTKKEAIHSLIVYDILYSRYPADQV